MIAIFALLCLPFLALAKKPENKPPCYQDWSSEEGHGCHHERNWPEEEILVNPDDESIFRFYFEGAGKPAQQNFIFYVTVPQATYKVWDCHCGGDQFEVWDQGNLLATINGKCNDANAQCNFQNDDPSACSITDGFCRGIIGLNAGFHNLTIVPITDYYGQGYGYLQKTIPA